MIKEKKTFFILFFCYYSTYTNSTPIKSRGSYARGEAVGSEEGAGCI